GVHQTAKGHIPALISAQHVSSARSGWRTAVQYVSMHGTQPLLSKATDPGDVCRADSNTNSLGETIITTSSDDMEKCNLSTVHLNRSYIVNRTPRRHLTEVSTSRSGATSHPNAMPRCSQ